MKKIPKSQPFKVLILNQPLIIKTFYIRSLSYIL